MSLNSLEALRGAGIISGTMAPALEEFYNSLSEHEVEVLISTKNRLLEVLGEVEAHQAWEAPEASQEGFDAAMLCACSIWSGAGSK